MTLLEVGLLWCFVYVAIKHVHISLVVNTCIIKVANYDGKPMDTFHIIK